MTFSANPNGGDPLRAALERLQAIYERRPSRSLMTGKTPKAADAILRILNAAEAVFVERGYAGLSLRKVAEAADMAVGNLTYHFPTREALIRAVLLERQALFINRCLKAADGNVEDPVAILEGIVGFYLREARNEPPTYYHIWSYATTSESARAFVADIYNDLSRFALALVKAANPALDDEKARRIVFELACLSEGARAMIGFNADRGPSLEFDPETFERTISIIIFGAAPSESPAP